MAIGLNPRVLVPNAWAKKNTQAMRPDSTKAFEREDRPTASSRPHTMSSAADVQVHGDVENAKEIGNLGRFRVSWAKNVRTIVMHSTLRSEMFETQGRPRL